MNPRQKTTMSENTIFKESYRAYSATVRQLSSKNRSICLHSLLG